MLDLAQLDANEATGEDDAFSYIGSAAFSGTAGELRFVKGVLQGDGDGEADLRIKMGKALL